MESAIMTETMINSNTGSRVEIPNVFKENLVNKKVFCEYLQFNNTSIPLFVPDVILNNSTSYLNQTANFVDGNTYDANSLKYYVKITNNNQTAVSYLKWNASINPNTIPLQTSEYDVYRCGYYHCYNMQSFLKIVTLSIKIAYALLGFTVNTLALSYDNATLLYTLICERVANLQPDFSIEFSDSLYDVLQFTNENNKLVIPPVPTRINGVSCFMINAPVTNVYPISEFYLGSDLPIYPTVLSGDYSRLSVPQSAKPFLFVFKKTSRNFNVYPDFFSVNTASAFNLKNFFTNQYTNSAAQFSITGYSKRFGFIAVENIDFQIKLNVYNFR